ncbi:MAG TPA: glucosaminidase domain-containing protein [Candidatus Angelobacter sp.]|nr:glucosaminidase domain-containing protein [Candidatus Angelobacter sp.]
MKKSTPRKSSVVPRKPSLKKSTPPGHHATEEPHISHPEPSTHDQHFPPEIVQAAESSMRKWRVPASVTLAQWAQESAFGKDMPTGSNNPFGIKAVEGQPSVSSWTHEHIHGSDVRVVAKFRKFQTIEEAFEHHAELLATAPVYSHAMGFVHEPDQFADALTGVYATDPHYGAELKNLMKTYNLYQYDRPAAEAGPRRGARAS